MPAIPIQGEANSVRLVAEHFDRGWSTRTFPHLLDERQLYVADNVVFNRDGLVSKRPGNALYGTAGGRTGATGSGVASLSGTRFYPVGGAPQLLVQSGGKLWRGNDASGAFTQIGTGFSATTPATYAQVYDPDMTTGPATAVVICDGSRVPQLWDGTNLVPVQTGTYAAAGGAAAGNYLPTGRSGLPLTPRYCLAWHYNFVYAGDSTEPTGLYISDALRPERFNGFGLIDSAATPYTAYFPGGRDGRYGVITGLAEIGPFLVIFFTSGVVVGYNTGTYGAFQYQFQTISATTGCVAPKSIVSFDSYVVFFGGDQFYATDGNTVVPVPDEIPSVYANTSQSVFPSEMVNKTIVSAARRGGQYLASYDNIGNGQQTAIAMFDTQAGGGYTFGATEGGTWSRFPTGMTLAWGVECRGPGDTMTPFFWGSSLMDRIAQFDVGTYDDFGAAIAIEVRAKAFSLERPIWPKDVQGLYFVLTSPVPYLDESFVNVLTGYVITDFSKSNAPPISLASNLLGTVYGPPIYGTVEYSPGNSIITVIGKSYPQQDAKGAFLQPGFVESSIYPLNLIAMVMEVIVDEPAP